MTEKTQPIDPVTVTVIGTDGLHKDTVATTPGLQPNLIITVIGPVLAIVIRFGNLFLTTLVGLVSAGMVSDVIPAGDFAQLVLACAKLSVSVAGLGAIKDTVTIFGRLEQKFPLSTGSV